MAKKTDGITKREAVRQALEALGRDAKPAQLRPYIKQTFGLDMTPGHITTAKGELLRGAQKGTTKQPASAPRAGQRPTPQATRGVETMANRANGPTKQEAVQKAVEALGRDARPPELQAYVKEQFGLDMTLGHVKTARNEFLRGGKKGKKKPGREPKAPPAPQPTGQPAPTQPARAPAPASGAGNGIRLGDIEAVKGLLGRVSPDQLKGLIDLLAR